VSSLKLCKGAFGHVSVLSVACDLVTHAHPEAHVIVWLEGNPGRMTVGETQVDVRPGLAVCVNSFEPHSHSFDGNQSPGSFLAFYMDPRWIEGHGMSRRAELLFSRPAIAIDDALRASMERLLRLVTAADEASAADAHEIEALMEGLLRDILAAQAEGQPLRMLTRRSDYRIRKAMELMQGDVAGRQSMDEVARRVGLSRPHFFALFKDQLHVTPNVFWNALRMKEALRQVECADEPLTDVACNLGFSTQGNFTRFFRDHAGVPPTLYREASRSAA
jgi:AraC-like DNA-binding protein/mannose-6-phosphate isomerase-like protein (cupin superfamily)